MSDRLVSFVFFIITLTFFGFIYLILTPQRVSAALYSCSVTLASPSTIDASQPIKFSVATLTKGEGNWKLVYEISGPFGWNEGSNLGSVPSQGTTGHYDIDKAKYSGTHTLRVQANNSSGSGDTDFDHVTCSGSPITITVTGGEDPPEPEPPTTPPSPDPLCGVEFADGSSSKTVNKGESVVVRTTGSGTSGFGSHFVIKKNGHQEVESPGSASITVGDLAGSFTFIAYHVVLGSSGTRVEHKCTGSFPFVHLTVTDPSSGGDEGGGSIVKITPTEGSRGDVNEVAGNFAKKFLNFGIGIAGGIAFLLMVFGAYRLIFAGGNPDSIQQGREIITAAIAGLLVIIFAVFILSFLGYTVLGIDALN